MVEAILSPRAHMALLGGPEEAGTMGKAESSRPPAPRSQGSAKGTQKSTRVPAPRECDIKPGRETSGGQSGTLSGVDEACSFPHMWSVSLA